MAVLDKLLTSLVERGMEVLILEPGSRPRMRRDGSEHDASSSALAGPTIANLLEQVAPDGMITDDEAEVAMFSYEAEEETFSFACMRSADGWSAMITVEGAQDAMPPAEPPRETVGLSVGRPAPNPDGETLITGVDQLLHIMLDRGASDLHLSSMQHVRIRVDGELVRLEEFAPPLPEWLDQILGDIIPDRSREEYGSRNDTDFAHELDDVARFRVNVFRDRNGIGAVFRVIPNEIPGFDDLGLPDSLRRVCDLDEGLVLVTGPTGAGKSTTLAALVDLVNRERSDHIITIEDPIEFVHESKGCLVNQREVGQHTASFVEAMRAALREDPDVVLVGEMGDLETARLALEAAETGHLVLGALPSVTAAQTLDRLINQFPADRQAQVRVMLSGSLKAVVSQTLVRRAAGGRVAAREILVSTPEVADLVRDGRVAEVTAVLEGGEEGMTTLNQSLHALVEAGEVEAGDALAASPDRSDLEARFEAAGVELDPARA